MCFSFEMFFFVSYVEYGYKLVFFVLDILVEVGRVVVEFGYCFMIYFG